MEHIRGIDRLPEDPGLQKGENVVFRVSVPDIPPNDSGHLIYRSSEHIQDLNAEAFHPIGIDQRR